MRKEAGARKRRERSEYGAGSGGEGRQEGCLWPERAEANITPLWNGGASRLRLI